MTINFRTEGPHFDDKLLNFIMKFLANVVGDKNADIHIPLDSVRLLRALELWADNPKEAKRLLKRKW